MTREEQLACLTERPCEVCKFYGKNGCGKWNCVFEEEPTDTEPCEDAISRDYLLSIANMDESYGYVSAHDIAKAPSVTPKQKMGRWIEHKYNWSSHLECSECSVWFARINLVRKSYCPNCGAKMEES